MNIEKKKSIQDGSQWASLSYSYTSLAKKHHHNPNIILLSKWQINKLKRSIDLRIDLCHNYYSTSALFLIPKLFKICLKYVKINNNKFGW